MLSFLFDLLADTIGYFLSWRMFIVCLLGWLVGYLLYTNLVEHEHRILLAVGAGTAITLCGWFFFCRGRVFEK